MKSTTTILWSGLLVTALARTAAALPPVPAPAQTEPIALVGATAHLGNGELIESAVVTIAEGRITAVGSGPVDTSGHRVVDVTGRHLYPGFVLPDSDLGLQEVGSIPATIDHEEIGELNPNLRSLVAYNTDSEITPTTRFNGILVAQISPNGGLVSGTSSIVELDGWGWEDAALATDDGLHVRWPSAQVQEMDWSTFTMRRVINERYDEEMALLEKLFHDAVVYSRDPERPASNLKLAAMQGLFEGRQRLYVHVQEARDIVLAVTFAESQGVQKIVVITREAALDVADFLVEHGVPVIVAGVHRLPTYEDDPVDFPYRLPALLVAEGVKVGLSYPSVMNARNLPFLAGTAAAYGLDREEALRMITLDNAEILGIDDRVGSIEVGKDATLFVSRGDALDMRGNQLELAFIRGAQIELDGMQQELYRRYHERYADR